MFREKGREGEREGEKHQCVVTSHAPPTGDLACNPGLCPDWELNWGPFGSQASTESIEPHQSGNSSYHPFTKTPHGFLLYYSAKANIKKYH